MELRFIQLGDPLFEQELSLRHRVLRDPLGLPKDAVRFPFEERSLHLVALQEARVVGCVLFVGDHEGGGRLYQMAVAPELQGRGVGRELVQALHARLRDEGVQRVHLHARLPAAAFYEKLGYARSGEPFIEVGIEHITMTRRL